jgi:hypothetical protein
MDMIVHYGNAVNRIREKVVARTNSQTIHVAIAKFKEIELAASRVFTAANFFIPQDELRNIGGLEILNVLEI